MKKSKEDRKETTAEIERAKGMVCNEQVLVECECMTVSIIIL